MIKIFDANDTDFSTNGNIVIAPLKCMEYKKKSLNGWYIEVEIPIRYAKYIEKDKLCVVKTRSKINPQAFRIGDTIKKTNRKISFTANHVMFDSEKYFLLDVRPTNLNGAGAVEYVNARTDTQSPFRIVSNVENINTEYFIRRNLLEAWKLIEERWNGIFDADNYTIYFLNSIGNDNGESIIYGKNLENMTIFEDWSNVCTKICPVGYDGLLLPETYLESEVQYETPYTRKIEFDTELDIAEATENEMISELRRKAIDYLNNNKHPKVSYEIISNINQKMEIGDIIHVKHPLTEIHTEVLEYVNDIIQDKVVSLTFGNYTRDVKNRFENIKSSINELKNIVSKQEIVINEQTSLINTFNKEGYVYIDDNEILILDTLPKERAKNVWRFGLGGIGFSSDGYEGPFKVAMTMDGQINADFITTGKLSVNIIEGLSETLDRWAEIMIGMENIKLIVQNTVDITKEVEENSTSCLVLENCMEGNLLELRIRGDNNVFGESEFNLNTKFDSDSTFIGQSSIIEHYTDNICQLTPDDCEQGAFGWKTGQKADYTIYLRVKEFIEIRPEYSQLKIDINSNYRLVNLYYYDKDKNYLGDNNSNFPSNRISNTYSATVTILENAKYFAIIFKNKNTTSNSSGIDIFPEEIVDINPQIQFSKKIDLGLTDPLRCYKMAYINDEGEIIEVKYKDEVVIQPETTYLIKRVGVDERGNTYKLDKEIIQRLESNNIYLLSGKNYIKAYNYTAELYAKYVITNEFTKLFTTQVELTAAIEILSNQIALAVKQGSIIAALNLALQNGEGIISIIGNKLIINTDNTKLDGNGRLETVRGKIGAWNLDTDILYNRITENGNEIEAGLFATSSSGGPFFYSGRTPGENIYNSNFYVTHNGDMKVKRVKMNGESGYSIITYDSGRSAMVLDKSQLIFRLDDNANTIFGSLIRGQSFMQINLLGALGFVVYDELHQRQLYQAATRSGNVPYHYFTGEMWMDRDLDGTFVQVAQSGDWSDCRLKKDIKDCKVSALNRIKKMNFKEFTWNETAPKAGIHVDIGLTAQPLKDIDPNYVETHKRIYQGEEQDLLAIDVLNLLTTTIKGVQELDLKVEKLEKGIELLAKKIGCEDEVKEILKDL